MYAAGGDHRYREPCRRILELVAAGTLDGVISAEVVQEILHRFTAIGRPEVGAEMGGYALDVFAPVLPVTHRVMRRTVKLVARYPNIPARDLVHVGTCQEEGISVVVSPDVHFDEVVETRRVDPADEEAVGRLS